MSVQNAQNVQDMHAVRAVEAVEIRAFAVRPERTDEGFGTPLGTLIPSRQRRAASPLARTIADLYSALAPSFTTPHPIVVTGSAYGETETAIVLIEGHLNDPSGVSPARFAASVHNTAAGLVGIATGNVAPATAIAAGEQTFAMALVEAIASVRTTGSEVAVLVAEQALPAALAPKLLRPRASRAYRARRPTPPLPRPCRQSVSASFSGRPRARVSSCRTFAMRAFANRFGTRPPPPSRRGSPSASSRPSRRITRASCRSSAMARACSPSVSEAMHEHVVPAESKTSFRTARRCCSSTSSCRSIAKRRAPWAASR